MPVQDSFAPEIPVRAVLPNAELRFADRIDLMDETLREGAERATVPPTIADKADLAEAIAATGIRTLVVGMFPDVPHNVALLRELVRRQGMGRIAADVRFMVISHVGVNFERSVQLLASERIPTETVWLIAIHSVSDLQIRHLFSTIRRMDTAAPFDEAAWLAAPVESLRTQNLAWLDAFLPSLATYRGGGVMVGLLDAFRADQGHLLNAVDVVARQGVSQIRLVDTAGTCMPQQVPQTVGQLISRHPGVSFYGHFHDDFGMATANAIAGLALGLRGVDVSVGGFANRAGHPPVAEVAMALKKLYGVTLPGFRYEGLSALSRLAEQLYGLMENPAQAITGVITHGILTGIRTELHRQAPTIFDIIDPAEVGAELIRNFGLRSGTDGLARFLRESRLVEDPHADVQALALHWYPALEAEWQRRNLETHQRLRHCIDAYHAALRDSVFGEAQLKAWLEPRLAAVEPQPSLM